MAPFINRYDVDVTAAVASADVGNYSRTEEEDRGQERAASKRAQENNLHTGLSGGPRVKTSNCLDQFL